MNLKERMSNKLQELYSSLGFSKDVLNDVAEFAVSGLDENCDDAALEAHAKGFEGMLKSFQSNTEKRVTEAVKRASEEKNKSGQQTSQQQQQQQQGDEPAWFKTYREAREAEEKKLREEIESLRSAKFTEDFDKVVKRVAKGLGLSGEVLELAKAGLSSDMDENAVKDALGKAKKTLIEAGAKIGSEERTPQMTQSEEEAARKAAASWVEAEAKRIAEQNQ